MMLKFMIEDNNLPLDEHLFDPEQDIDFIEELMTGKQGPQAVCCRYMYIFLSFSLYVQAQHKDKTFLYEVWC